jgi:hypothetical protein
MTPDFLDGRLGVNTPAAALLDGAAAVQDDASGLLDGLASVPLMVRSASAAWRDYAPVASWTLPAATPQREIFVAVLRKTGLADCEVPVGTLQMRRRDGYPTMIACVVPDADTYYAAAAARQDGELIVYAGSATADGTRHLSELERVTLEDVSYDIGVASSSLTLEGYRTASVANPRPVALSGLTYRGLQADGKRRVRGSVNIFLRPGDTATFGLESLVVDQIYVWVSAENAWMEVAGS